MNDSNTIAQVVAATTSLFKLTSSLLGEGSAPPPVGDAPPGPLPELQPLDPSDALLDLRLPALVREMIAPALAAIGFTLEDEEAMERYGNSTRTYTVAQRAAQRRILIHVPPWLLGKFSQAKRNALAAVPFAFPAQVTIYVFAFELDAPERTHRKVIENDWVRRDVTGIFIPWRDVSDLAAAATDPPKRRNMLIDMLKLDQDDKPPTERPNVRLKPVEIQGICASLCALSSFQDVRGRRTMIALAGLGDALSGFDFTGEGRTVAGDLVLRIDKIGWLKDRPDTHALGALLDSLRALTDLPSDQQKLFTSIIQTYQLIPSTP